MLEDEIIEGDNMSILDFKEIPKANTGEGNQDTFEQFSREFLELMGFSIISEPDRGPDGGKDMIVEELRQGPLSSTTLKWLVSCKHQAHTGRSVTPKIENNIIDRLTTHDCQGFLAIYSTLPSSGLNTSLVKFKEKYETEVFDNEVIERVLLETDGGMQLIRRFFPKSYKEIASKAPSNILAEYEPLCCEACGVDMLDEHYEGIENGIIVFVEDKEYRESNPSKHLYVDICYCCKLRCDEIIEQRYEGYSTAGWYDISDLLIPTQHINYIIAIMNGIRSGKDKYTDEAYEKMKRLLIIISQHTMRHQSKEQLKRARDLFTISQLL